MGDCHTKVTELRFIIEDELTQCYVAVKAWGDCPIMVQGWHHKTFPASKTVTDIINEDLRDHLLWPKEAPPA